MAAAVVLAMCIESAVVVPAQAAQVPTGSSGSYLFTPCTETIAQLSPVSARPLAPRRTLASPLPHRPRARRTVKRHHRPHRVVARKPVVRTAVAHHRPHKVVRRHKAAHRPRVAQHRPLLRKITYGSPLCADRAPMINALLGDMPTPLFQPVAAPDDVFRRPLTQLADAAPMPVGPASSTPIIPGIPTPNVPLVPIIPPVVTPPVVVPVPEPASWSMMILGFGAVGAIARRTRRRTGRAARSEP